MTRRPPGFNTRANSWKIWRRTFGGSSWKHEHTGYGILGFILHGDRLAVCDDEIEPTPTVQVPAMN
jgi:hypothetical protein